MDSVKMDAREFITNTLEKSEKDYGIFPPPTDAQEGLNILFKHFLGDEWYVSAPISQSQVNTQAIYDILKKYPKKRRLFKWLREGN